MIPEPWTVPSLPAGLTSHDFDDAGRALVTQQLTGRIIPVPAALNRARTLSGTEYDHNARRINAARGYPTLAGIPHVPVGPNTGLVLPGLLWLDSSAAEGTRPVACIGPNGYYGSLYAGDLSKELHNFVRTEATRGRLIAVPVELRHDSNNKGRPRRPPRCPTSRARTRLVSAANRCTHKAPRRP